MAWKFLIVCPRCEHLGKHRRASPCKGCAKYSTLARPSRFKGRRPEK